MPRIVKDEGPLSAKIVLVGEAPGRQEDESGRPFVGKSGAKLEYWWRQVGLRRSQIYITNVHQERPPENKIAAISPSVMAASIDSLHERLALLEDPNVIVPTGNTALQALTGQRSITKYRGSILNYIDHNGRHIKVIPTIHPASIFHMMKTGNPGRVEKHCLADWQRIANEAASPEFNLPERHHDILPTHKECQDYLEEVRDLGPGEALSVDIETAQGKILCVGFAFQNDRSFVIPLEDKRHWSTDRDVHRARETIEEICGTQVPKILQNGLYDTYWLAQLYGIDVRNYVWDVKAMHHTFDPVDDHSLAYMQSVYTREPFHKDEAKDPDKVSAYASNLHALQTYCGLDNCVQHELYEVFHGRLMVEELLDFYLELYPDLFQSILHMMMGGIRTASSTRKLAHMRIHSRLIEIQDALSGLLGEKIYAKTGLSPIKIRKLLYEKLGLPVQRNRQTGNVTTDEVALLKLNMTHPAEAQPAIPLILEHRRQSHLMQFFDEGATDHDGYIRCEYTTTTEAGRLASKSNPLGTGRNLQNVDREVRDTFLPDEGHIFLEADLSQAESKVVYVLSGDPELIRLAQLPSWEFDQHTYNAAQIFGISEKDVTKAQRDFGKKTVHGAQRGLRGKKMSDGLLKDGYVVDSVECDAKLDRYLKKFDIERYFKWVRKQMAMRRRLQNSWGRIWDITHERFGDDLFRRGYSFLPQSEVADLLNMWGLNPTVKLLDCPKYSKFDVLPARVCAQIHDAILVSTPPDEAYDIATFIQKSLERPRIYFGDTKHGVPLTIGVEFKIGTSWKGTYSFKRLPSRDEFNDHVRRLVDGSVK